MADVYHIYALDIDRETTAPRWAGIVRGLEIQLGTAPELANSVIDLDWVRLTTRGTVLAPLSWSNMGGAVSLVAVQSETGDQVQLAPGGLGPGATFAASGSYNWDYGFLPPGTWTITARSGSRTSNAVTLVVDAAPVIQITEPDATGGRDWATTVLADAWDMTNIEDVTRYGRMYQIVTGVFGENGLEGQSRGGNAGDPPSPFVNLLDNWEKPATSYPNIDANTYHRLSFTIQTDHPELVGNQALSATWGSVARVIWAKPTGRSRVSQDLFIMDGIPNTFTMDLAAMNSTAEVEEEVPGDLGPAWNGTDISTFAIRLNESYMSRGFRLANVKVAADDEPNGNGFFIVKWNASDATFTRAVPNGNGAETHVALYYDTDLDPTNKTLIAANIPVTNAKYAWDVAGLPPGVYYIYAVISDTAGNSQGRYAGGPVRVGGFAASLRTDSNQNGLPDWFEARYGATNPNADADGDGVSNLAEYQAGTNPLTSNVWSLSEGATGFFNQRLALANPDSAPADVTVTYLRPGGQPPITRLYSLLPYGRLTVNVNEIAGLRSNEVSTVVTTNNGGVVAERTMFWGDQWYGGHTGKALQNPSTEWFLAEGAANSRFSTFILLANATATVAHPTLTFLREGASALVYTPPALQPFSRLTVFTNDDVPGLTGAFSTRITSDVPITAERSMYFNGPKPMEGGSEAAAVTKAEKHWYVAEGATGFFDEYVLMANPNPTETIAMVRYLLPSGPSAPVAWKLPPNSRTTLEVKAQPGLASTEVSVEINANQDIVVERAMYWPAGNWIESHASAGITETGTLLALAEGEVGGSRGFESYILIANPSAQAAAVTLTFLREGGRAPITSGAFTVGAGARVSRAIGEFVGPGKLASGEKVGILISSTNGVPIVAERAMYWNGGGVFWGGGSNETAFTLK
jgi:hypothetical protein